MDSSADPLVRPGAGSRPPATPPRDEFLEACKRADDKWAAEPSARVKESRRKFLEAWKRAADECVDGIFVSLPIDGPAVSGDLKEAAVEAVMRMAWGRVSMLEEDDEFWANIKEIKEYASDLVDRTVAERWAYVTARWNRIEAASGQGTSPPPPPADRA